MRRRRNSQLAYPPEMERGLIQLLNDNADAIANKALQAQQLEVRQGALSERDRTLYRTTLPLNLDGVPDHYPKQKMMAAFRSIPVLVMIQTAGDPLGTWHLSGKKQGIRLYVDPDDAQYRAIGGGWDDAGQLRGTLRHELRHMVQTMLTNVVTGAKASKGTITAGIPAGAWNKAKSRYDAEIRGLTQELSRLSQHSPRAEEIRRELQGLKGKWGVDYYLDPSEFYPHMGNAKDKLLGGRSGLGERGFGQGKPITRDTFNHVTRTYPLFRTLQKYAPDIHRKAVSELAAWMNEHNTALANTKTGRPVTTSQILASVLARLDADDPALAAEIRARRPFYENYVNSLVSG